uniref:Secreted protein n=1 Tax=Bursaphelenchus xylophilus TaxID=6326 RepID=A0A1I7SH32_BURXY
MRRLFFGSITLIAYMTVLTHSARFSLAPNIRFGGEADNETLPSLHSCAEGALAGDYKGFGWCNSSSVCKFYITTSGYDTGNKDGCQYYARNDSHGDYCDTTEDVGDMIKNSVYDNGECPTGFTYDSSEKACFSNMTSDECNLYNATWKYPYMPNGAYKCALYPKSQTQYIDDYACQNYGSTLQIFKGKPYCYSRIALPSTLASATSIVYDNGCSWLYDVNTNTLKIESRLEMDWILAVFGAVMVGAVKRTTLAPYLNYDNTTFNTFGKTIATSAYSFVVLQNSKL